MNRLFFLSCFIFTIFIASCQSISNDNSIKLSPEVFKDSLSNANIHLIDVRTLKEFRSGYISNALNINYNSEKFTDSLELLDTKKPVYIYCRSGKRSARSISIFKELGFNEIYELEGGIINWRKAGLKVESN